MRAWGTRGHPQGRACEYEPQEGWERTPEFYLRRGRRTTGPPTPTPWNAEPGAPLV